jgi:hypothetical protein
LFAIAVKDTNAIFDELRFEVCEDSRTLAEAEVAAPFHDVWLDTLLRVVRRRGSPGFDPPLVVRIDDWAWRRNQPYGTIICDLERRETNRAAPGSRTGDGASLALRPATDRRCRPRSRWRLRSGGTEALPQAVQVADRWHLMENASHAFRDAVRKTMRQMRVAIGAAKIDPDPFTAAETIHYLRREKTNAVVLGLAKDGVTIKEIVRRTGYSRGLVCKVLRGQPSDVFRVRQSSLEGSTHRGLPGAATARSFGDNSTNKAFRGCLRVVAEWAARRRQAEKGPRAKQSVDSAHQRSVLS